MSATVTPPAETFRYDRLTISLHWLTAILVAAQWVIGQSVGFFPRDHGQGEVRSTHIVLGLALLALVLVRLAWSKSPWGRRRPTRQGLGDLAARGLQLLLVLLLVATILLGMLNAAVRGDAVFTWVTLPQLGGGSQEIRRVVGELHEWGANLILAVVGLHAAAALAHHYVLRDGILRRMLPGRQGA